MIRRNYAQTATVACSIGLLASLLGAAATAAQSDARWRLEYDKKANRFTAISADATVCDHLGAGATLNDQGDACRYPPASLDFLSDLGFRGDADGFSARDSSGDVLVFMESRPADPVRYDATALRWALIEADEGLLEGATSAPGAVVGEAFDATAGPRLAVFVELSEPPIIDGDTLALNTNTHTDRDVGNDMVRSLDPSFPNGGGDTNISVGWSFIDDPEVRAPAVNVWSQAQQDLIPGNVVAGPSEDPPGIWEIIGPEHLGDDFNSMVLAKPDGLPLTIDRVEGTGGPFTSFPADGTTQAYFDGFTMTGVANVPGKDFQLAFHTPYARLFEGGSADIGYLLDTQEDFFSVDLEATESTLSLGLSLPTGATGLTSIELVPAQGAKVAAEGHKKPVALKKWLKGDQLAEINAAVDEIMALSMSSRFELADGQEVELGAGPG